MLGEFLRSYILNRPDVKPATLEVWGQPCRNLTEFFTEAKPLRAITPGDGDQFKAWLLTQKLAPATIAKRLSFVRTFFHVARKHKLIEDNPFAEVTIPAANVSARQRFIGREDVQKLLDHASPTWRTIIALARFGGLRCPSEVLSLEWRHVDWIRERVTVPSPKTERYDGKESRTIPMFADLREFLDDAYELREPGQTHVIGGNHLAKANGVMGWKNCNLRTSFGKLVKRAGLEQWPRLFHNLRSSRETELLETFPVHVVAKWMGHDAKVCLKHYAQTTEDHFARATRGAQSGANAAQNRAQHAAAGNGGESNNETEEDGGKRVFTLPCDLPRHTAQVYSGGRGIRTHGWGKPISGFQDRCIKPLCHPSKSAHSTFSTRPGPDKFAFSPLVTAAFKSRAAGGRYSRVGDSSSRDRRERGRAHVRPPVRAAPPAVSADAGHGRLLPGNRPRAGGGRPAPSH